MRKWVAIATVAVVVAAVVAGGTWWWRTQQRTDLEHAVSLAPGEAERLTWTDWRGARAELDVSVDAEASQAELVRFMDRGYEADLTSTSALLGSAETLHEEYGFSPASLEWELLSQSQEGAVVIMRLPESTDFDQLGDRLEGLGYRRPDSETGVWQGGAEVVARIAPGLTPELQYAALDAEERLVLVSDTGGYLEQVVAGLGEGGPEELEPVVAGSGEPLSALVYTGSHACTALAMSAADEGDQDQAEQLVAAAGEVNPMTGFAMSAQPGGQIRVVMSFENDEQARANADSRAALAAGPAPGQGGDFADRFEVDSVTAEDSSVTMSLDPVDGEYVLSDLGAGPVLFATC